MKLALTVAASYSSGRSLCVHETVSAKWHMALLLCWLQDLVSGTTKTSIAFLGIHHESLFLSNARLQVTRTLCD